MVFGLFDEPDKATVTFLGMEFKCNQEYFMKAIKEEIEVIWIFHSEDWH